MTVFYKFTTGPVENVIEGGPIGISNQVYVKALNNCKTNNAKVRIKVYSLNTGHKKLVDSKSFTLTPWQSDFERFITNSYVQYEIEVSVSSADVLVTVWGKNRAGRLVAAHRFTQQELTMKKIRRK